MPETYLDPNFQIPIPSRIHRRGRPHPRRPSWRRTSLRQCPQPTIRYGSLEPLPYAAVA